jgi:hypothetical protein
VSISTVEHIGWDERPRQPDKVLGAVDHVCVLLAPRGRFLVTAPLAYNSVLDEAVTGQLVACGASSGPREGRHLLARIRGHDAGSAARASALARLGLLCSQLDSIGLIVGATLRNEHETAIHPQWEPKRSPRN